MDDHLSGLRKKAVTIDQRANEPKQSENDYTTETHRFHEWEKKERRQKGK